MDLTALNLSEEQLKGVTDYVTGEVSKTKESFKDFISKEDFTKNIQSETDKVRTEYSKKMKELNEELVKYKPIEKTQAELDFEARIKKLENDQMEVDNEKKILNINKSLQEQGLPSQLSKYLVGAEDVETEISGLKEMFNALALSNSFVPTNHKAKSESITKEQFAKMSMADRENLYTTNKELYIKLSE